MTTIQIKNKSNTFIFTKERLEKKAKEVSKPIYVYDKRTRGLCAYLGRNGITYSAHWSNTEIAQDGTKFSVGKRKRFADFATPLEEVRRVLRVNYDNWITESKALVSGSTVGALVSQFIRDVIKSKEPPRLKAQDRLSYKPTTLAGYQRMLETYVLGNGKDKRGISYKDILKEPINVGGVTYEKGALKDVPLDKITRADVDVLMKRLKHIPAAANHTLAALSVVFEWDLRKPKNNLCKNNINPCQRVNKYKINADKRYIKAEQYIELRNYVFNNFWREPHFFAYYVLLVECGERQSDLMGLYWKSAEDDLKKAKDNKCTGWLNLEAEEHQVHIIDSKNRKPADVTLTTQTLDFLKRLNEMRYDNLAWCLASPFVFPQSKAIEKPISRSSYRKKIQKLHFRFGLADRVLIRAKGKRKLYKYIMKFTFKHLRKTFATQYASKKGVEATQLRMRHSSLEVTQNHYVTPQDKDLFIDDLFSAREERKDHKLKAIKGGLEE
jgi:hypothetical protein